MSSEEAVHIVAKLILDNADNDSADIAELFIEQVRAFQASFITAASSSAA